MKNLFTRTGLVLSLSMSPLLVSPVAAQEIVDYDLRGISAYDVNEINIFARQHVYNTQGVVTARHLAEAIELIYREDGFFLAEARVSSDGKTINVDEGSVEQVVIEGVDQKTYKTVKGYFEKVVGQKALTLKTFERAMMLTNDLAGVGVTSELDYPAGLLGARVRVLGHEVAQQAGSITIDNPPQRLGEELSVYVQQEYYSALTAGDLLRFEVSTSYAPKALDGAISGMVTYRAPIGVSGLYGELNFGNVVARRDSSGSLVQTDIRGRNITAALGYPVLRDIDKYGYLLFDIRTSQTESNSAAGSFDSNVSVLGTSYLHGKTFASGSVLEWGVNLSYGERSGGQPTSDDGDDTFWHLRAGLGYEGYVPAISPNTSWRTEIWGQYTDSRLPFVEELSLGDRNGLRGYASSEISGDSGVVAIFEVAHAIYPASDMFDRISPFGFVDVGFAKNNAPAAFETDSKTLASMGFGAEAVFSNNLQLSGYVAVPMLDGSVTKAREPAVYLSLSKSW